MAHYLKRTGENTWEFTCTEPATADCHWQCSNDSCYSANDHLDGDCDDENRNCHCCIANDSRQRSEYLGKIKNIAIGVLFQTLKDRMIL